MKAAQVAEALKARGIAVQEVTEGGHNVDGGVWITDQVSVNVSVFEEKISLTKIIDGFYFEFYQDRPASDIDGLIDDIRKACTVACA